jgi:hypothetical protein
MNNEIQTAVPLHEHGAFSDVQAALSFISLAGNALQGIGQLLQPEMSSHDRQLNNVNLSDVTPIFRFFGEALAGPVGDAYEANERLQMELARSIAQPANIPPAENIQVTRHPGITTF